MFCLGGNLRHSQDTLPRIAIMTLDIIGDINKNFEDLMLMSRNILNTNICIMFCAPSIMYYNQIGQIDLF